MRPFVGLNSASFDEAQRDFFGGYGFTSIRARSRPSRKKILAEQGGLSARTVFAEPKTYQKPAPLSAISSQFSKKPLLTSRRKH